MEKPVVVGAAGVSGMREIVICCGEEQCGYHIDPNNPSDIAWGVISALKALKNENAWAKTAENES